MVEVIAEFGQSCHGDLRVALKQADVAKEAGCSYLKLQTFAPERLVSPDAARYWDSSLGGSASQLETFRANGMLADTDWKTLGDYCRHIGVGFMSSPFDLEAVDLLVEAGVDALKVASGEITHRQLLRLVGDTGVPVVLSTGASSFLEIEQALDWLAPACPTLLVCTLAYPCDPFDAELGRIDAMRRAFPWLEIGYSDHTRRADTSLAAAAAGATLLEKHCTLDAGGGVPDDRMALEPGALLRYVRYASLGSRMRGTGVLMPTDVEQAARVGARRSVYAARNISEGETFREADFVMLRPAGGYAPAEVDVLVGRQATKHIPAGKRIDSGDVV